MSEIGADKLPKGWNWVTLREISDIAGGVTKGQKRRLKESTRLVPYLRVANVQRGYLDLKEIKEIEASEPEIDSLCLQPGDILFNEGGDRDKLGRGWVWNGELPVCVHQNHVFRARLRNGANNPKFISYYGNSFGQKYFSDHGKQTTNLASINLTKLGSLPIPLPPPEEQLRIVAEIEKQLTRLEGGVAALRRVQANLKRYRAAVLKAACEGRLVPTEAELALTGQVDPLFETGEALLARILKERSKNWPGRGKYKEPAFLGTNSPPRTPEGWTWATVEQLSTKVVDGTHHTPEYVQNGIAFISVKDIHDGVIHFDDCKFVSFETHAELSKRCHVANGDVLITKSGTIGRIAVVNTDRPFSLFVSVALIKPVHGIFDPKFLKLSLEGYIGSINISQDIKGALLKNLHLEDLRVVPLRLPPLAEQTRIVAEAEQRLSEVEGLEAAVSANLRRANRLRQSILEKAFIGDL